MQSKKNSLAALGARLASMLDDTSDIRWTQTQREEAINLAIQSVWPRYYDVVDIYPFDTYDYEKFIYPLPEGIDDIIALYLEPYNSDDPWWLATQWHKDGDLLYVYKSYSDYDTQKMRLVVARAPRELNTNAPTKTDGVTTADGSTFTSAAATFVTWGVVPGDDLWLYDGCSDEDDEKHWIIKSVDSETQVTVYGTFTASSTAITYYVNYYTFVPEMFILHKAASELYQLSGHQGASQDIAEDMQWAEFHANLAEYYISLQGKPYPAKRTA